MKENLYNLIQLLHQVNTPEITNSVRNKVFDSIFLKIESGKKEMGLEIFSYNKGVFSDFKNTNINIIYSDVKKKKKFNFIFFNCFFFPH